MPVNMGRSIFVHDMPFNNLAIIKFCVVIICNLTFNRQDIRIIIEGKYSFAPSIIIVERNI